MNCIETIDVMDHALEGRLAAPARDAFDEHLAECDPCRTYFDQLGATVIALGRLVIDPGSSARRAELLELFKTRTRGRIPPTEAS